MDPVMPRWMALATRDRQPERIPAGSARRAMPRGDGRGHGRATARPVLAGPVLALLLLPMVARAEPGCPVVAAVDAETIRVRAVTVAGSVEIVPVEGPVLRLAGLLVLPEDAEAARAELLRQIGDAPMQVSGPQATDRHGRRVVRLRRPGEALPVEATLIESGLALLTGADDADGCLTTLLTLEAGARHGQRGLWARRQAGPFSATDPELASRAGRFALVEGRILSTGQTSRIRFLNFGSRWTLDFTATISESDRETFAAAGVDPATLAGARVRVRGWLLSRDGGAMRLFHPGQIERLGMSE